MKKLSIHVLGGCSGAGAVAGGVETRERNYADAGFNACVVAETEDALYVMDAGDPAAFVLRDQRLNKPLRGVFLSHLDGDHFIGLWALLMEHATPGCLVAIPVPPSELGRWEAVMATMDFPFEPKNRVRWVSLQEGYSYQDGDFLMETHPTNHWRHMEKLPGLVCRPYVDYQPCFAFRIQYGGVKFIYSGDYASPTDIDPWLREGADLALLDSVHVPPVDIHARQLAEYPKVSLISLTHQSPHRGNPNAVVERTQSFLPQGMKVMKTTPGIEFRFDQEALPRQPRIIPFSERIKGRGPVFLSTLEEVNSYCLQRGIPTQWRLLGPFDNPLGKDKEYHGLEQDHGVNPKAPLTGAWTGKGGVPLHWREVSAKDPGFADFGGMINLLLLIGGDERLAYAHARFEVPETGDYDILFSSDDGMKMWIDGVETFFLNACKGSRVDEFCRTVRLNKGVHEVLLAVEQRFAAWIFYWRVIPHAS